MNKRFIAYLFTLSSDHRDVWLYLWSKSDDKGVIKASVNSIALALSIHREAVRRIVYYDPASPFYMVGKPILRQEDQSRWNSRELTIEFFLEKEIEESFTQTEAPFHIHTTSAPPIEPVEDQIAKKISKASEEEHWINAFIKESLPNVAKMKTQMTIKQAIKIDQKYNEALVMDKLKKMDNYVKGTKKTKLVYQIYSSVYGTLDEWCQRASKGQQGEQHKGGQEEIALSFSKKGGQGNLSRIISANEGISDLIEKGNISLKK